MKLSILRDKTQFKSVVVKITLKEDKREIKNSLFYCKCICKDLDERAILILWNEQIKKVKEGDIIEINDGWCEIKNGTKYISLGKNGKLKKYINNFKEK